VSVTQDARWGAATAGTLGARLAAARGRAFVGRISERELFRAALAEDPPPFAVLFLHGPGGVGKSALLRQLADEAEATGRIAAIVDGRATEGDPARFLTTLAGALGLPDGADPESVLHAGPPTALLIDSYEAMAGLDTWVREIFVPGLPADALVVIAGRDPPVAAWRVDPSWHDLVRVVALRNLAPGDARALLAARGVPARDHDQIIGLAGGYPLALSLIADVAAQTGRVPETHGQVPDVVGSLLDRFLSEAPSPVHREALQICAHARYTTEALLRSVLPEGDAEALFGWLRDLSFVDQGPHGVSPHDIVRDVVDDDLRWRDPDRYADLHRRIRRHVVHQLRTARGQEQERAVLEAHFLHRHNPVFNPYLTWQEPSAAISRRLSPTDVPSMLAMSEEFQGQASADVVAFWAAHRPEAFTVFERPGQPGVSGFSTLLVGGAPTAAEIAADPVMAALARWMRAQAPLRPDDHVFVGRYFLFRHAYGLPCPEFDQTQARSLLLWLNDPRLAWSFILAPAAIAAFWEPQMRYIDMVRAEGAEAAVGDTDWVAFARDWRASPAEDWLELLGERELARDLDAGPLTSPRPAPLMVLSQEEFAQAVRGALRLAGRPVALAASPLTRSRVVVDAGADTDPGETLSELLVSAVDSLLGEEQGDKLHRAVATTYFKAVPTQEAAAQRLGLPFSTYRRHLAQGTQRVVEWLWDRELHGL
jgi:hypothetical protein